MTLKLSIESAMGVVRRFLNLIVENSGRGTKSLRCIDLNRQKLFNTSAPARWASGSGSESEGEPQDTTSWAPGSVASSRKKKQAASVALKLGRISLPRPILNFEASGTALDWSLECFPLSGRKVLCADQSGRTLLYDADARFVAVVPDLNKPKSLPVSIFAASTDAYDNDGGGGGTLFIMERFPEQETDRGHPSHQFEAFVYRKATSTSFTESWNCQLLPPPPFVCDPKYWHSRPKISSYGVVDSSSSICLSVDGAGTYCLDTVKHTWSPAGEWTLPFRGKFEYVPDLRLWFGISAKDRRLTAVDLSSMDSPPQIVDSWKELEPPEGWTEVLDPQLVSMGSGRFCIARFFQTWIPGGLFGEELVERYFSVITGVDVVQHVGNGSVNANGGCNGSISNGYGKAQLGIIKHRSRRHMSYGSDGNIRAVF